MNVILFVIKRLFINANGNVDKYVSVGKTVAVHLFWHNLCVKWQYIWLYFKAIIMLNTTIISVMYIE